MRVRGLGVVASVSLAFYVCFAGALTVIALVGSRSGWAKIAFYWLFFGLFFIVRAAFPSGFSEDAPSPRLTAGRVAGFLLALAALLAGYFLALDASWAAGRELGVTLGLLACSTLCFDLLEKRWARQDARRGARPRAWS